MKSNDPLAKMLSHSSVHNLSKILDQQFQAAEFIQAFVGRELRESLRQIDSIQRLDVGRKLKRFLRQYFQAIDSIPTLGIGREFKESLRQHLQVADSMRALDVGREFKESLRQLTPHRETIISQESTEPAQAVSEVQPVKKEKTEPLSMEECRQILKDNLL